MLRSPNKEVPHYSSAPDLNADKDPDSPDNINITQRSKRRRCECGTESSDESKLDKFIKTLSLWRQETDTKLSNIQSSMQDIMRQNSDVLKSLRETEKSIEFLSNKYDDLVQQVSTQQNKAESILNSIISVENSSEEIDRRTRASSLEIRNIRSINKNPNVDEQIDIAMRLFEELEVESSTSDIYDIRRVPTRTDGITLVCNLNSVILKNKILAAYKNYNKRNASNKLNSSIVGGPQQPIFIAEHLTARARRLFFLAREYARTEGFKHCWTAGGRVLLRKDDNTRLIVVTDESQLKGPQPKN